MAALKRNSKEKSEREREERRMDDIFYLVASYDRLFGSGHCTASTVKTRKSPRGETRRPSCKPCIPVISSKETNDPDVKANKISPRSSKKGKKATRKK